jgi:hypothetical protein
MARLASSDALYPALRRLERRGLLSRQPVEPATVGADLGIHLMRFVMAEHALSPDETLDYLSDLAAALEAFISDIERYLQDTPLPGRHSQLALLHGIEIHQASLRWAHSAITALRAAQPSTGRNTS